MKLADCQGVGHAFPISVFGGCCYHLRRRCCIWPAANIRALPFLQRSSRGDYLAHPVWDFYHAKAVGGGIGDIGAVGAATNASGQYVVICYGPHPRPLSRKQERGDEVILVFIQNSWERGREEEKNPDECFKGLRKNRGWVFIPCVG